MATRVCTKCLIEKNLEENFSAHKRYKDGRRTTCKQCRCEESKINYEKNINVRREKRKQRYEIKREEELKYNKNYYSIPENKNRKIINQRNRRKNDKLFNLKHGISALIRNAFNRNGYTKKSKTAKILGCDYNTLITYLESKFKDGMNWDNRSHWHIDHISPLYMANTEEELIKLNHYTNLQPLWKDDNLRKSNKIEVDNIINFFSLIDK